MPQSQIDQSELSSESCNIYCFNSRHDYFDLSSRSRDILNHTCDAMIEESEVDRILNGVSISGSSSPALERGLEKGQFTHILVRVCAF